jgi:hypothetical protein
MQNVLVINNKIWKTWITLPSHPTNSVAQEPEGSSPHTQQPATGPCPETVGSNPHTPRSQCPQDPFWSHLPTYALVFRVITFLRAFPPKPFTLSLLSHACHMPCPPHSPRLNQPSIWGFTSHCLPYVISRLLTSYMNGLSGTQDQNRTYSLPCCLSWLVNNGAGDFTLQTLLHASHAIG